MSWIYFAVGVLLLLPFTRVMATIIVDDIGEDGPAELGLALLFGAMGALVWPGVFAALLIWKALSLPVVRRTLVPESKAAKIRRLEDRNAQLEQELGLLEPEPPGGRRP